MLLNVKNLFIGSYIKQFMRIMLGDVRGILVTISQAVNTNI